MKAGQWFDLLHISQTVTFLLNLKSDESIASLIKTLCKHADSIQKQTSYK